MKLTWKNFTIFAFFLSLLASCGGGSSTPDGGVVPVAQGSASSPVSISLSTPYAGSVDKTISYYRIPVTAGSIYKITVTAMTDDVDLAVWRTNLWSSDALGCTSGNLNLIDEQCEATATQTALYIQVLGGFTNAGAFFTLTVTPVLPAAPAGVIAIAGNSQVTVSWSPVSDATSYNLYFSQTSGAGKGGTKIAGVTSPHVHTGRTNGVTYYYVVTSVNANGESVASAQVAATPVAALTLPQSFNFDNGTLQGWSATGAWGVTSAAGYFTSSPYSVTDSPNVNYSNNANTSITSPVFDLTGAVSPTLSFYHEYSIETFDRGYVEVSTDGGVTFVDVTPIVDGYVGEIFSFANVAIDLSSFKTSSVVIRFRLQTDWNGVFDGWYIDDISITN